MPSLKKTLVYFLPVQVKKAKDSEIFATKRKMCWLRKGPGGQGVWEFGNTVRILFANPIHYTYREHITKTMQKRQRNKWVDCKVGLGGQLFMLGSCRPNPNGKNQMNMYENKYRGGKYGKWVDYNGGWADRVSLGLTRRVWEVSNSCWC